MKFGIIGLSLTHPYTFSDILIKCGHSIDYIWDKDLTKAAKFAERYHAKAVNHFIDIPTSDIDGVFIETESNLHCSTALHFMKNKVPVFIDKVMALNVRELKEILELAKKNKTLLMSGSAIRYKPEYIELRKDIQAGKSGRVIAITADVRHNMIDYLKEPNTWQDRLETSGGEIMNFGIHGVEPVYSILGPGVSWVQCHRDKVIFQQAKSEDLAIMNIKFCNGSMATISLISCINDYGFSMKVYGVEGVLEAGEINSSSSNRFIDDKYGYEKMILEFVNAIQKGNIPIPYDEIEEVVKVLIALRISADENRIVYIEEIK
jgi:predicted dehydrogenase